MVDGDRDARLLTALEFFDGKLIVKGKKLAEYNDPAEGLATLRALTPAEERLGRVAIASLLRSSSPPRELLDRLAGVFEPDDGTDPSSRRAELTYRAGNRPGDWAHAAQLIIEVELFRQQGVTVEVARHEVARRHGIKESAVKSTLENWADLRKEILGRLHPQK